MDDLVLWSLVQAEYVAGQILYQRGIAGRCELDAEPLAFLLKLVQALVERHHLAAVFVELRLQAGVQESGHGDQQAEEHHARQVTEPARFPRLDQRSVDDAGTANRRHFSLPDSRREEKGRSVVPTARGEC